MAESKPEPASDAEALLAATPPRFQAVHRALGAVVRTVFPEAQEAVGWGMPGWIVLVPRPPAEAEWKGTLPRTHLTILASAKKAGLTFHVWHPNRPGLLADEAAWLREAGFRPMVGCVQWNRKADPPMDAFERLLRIARDAF